MKQRMIDAVLFTAAIVHALSTRYVFPLVVGVYQQILQDVSEQTTAEPELKPTPVAVTPAPEPQVTAETPKPRVRKSRARKSAAAVTPVAVA